ncbi:hypothetical protein Bbelb_127910 [Branchiostoma belcheri]|nr:hypothetical protein Bbelb_127910 [Branchiostoma belcheri]
MLTKKKTEQEAVVLIRPVDGTDMKKHPFFREQLQTAVDSIADKIAHVQEVFLYMTSVEATSVAQSCCEPEVLETICLEIIHSRRKDENPSSHHTGQTPAVLLNDETSVALLKNVVSLLSYNLVTSDPRHRSVIFYKLQSLPLLAADAMYRAFPTAKTVFLYRNGAEIYESFTRISCKNQVVYRALRSLARFGLWRWVPGVPYGLKDCADDPKFSTVRYHGSYYHHVVARWLSGMQRAVELRRKYPEHFFHAVVNYTALARDKQETLHLLMKKLEIEWNPEDMKEERKRLKKAFAEDSQSGTFFSRRQYMWNHKELFKKPTAS